MKLRVFILWILLTSCFACVSARMSDRDTDQTFRKGQYEEAASRLKLKLAEEGEKSPDLLLYYLDIGLALHSAGKYAESNEYLLKADQIAEIKDYTSLAAEATTLLTSENIKDYKGEDFEKVLINTYLAMNYALMGDFENALVEARRVNRKLYLMITEGKRRYQQSAFARYLSAVLYEVTGEYNDAYIDYKKTYELLPGYTHIKYDLWRTAWILKMRDQMQIWSEKFKLTQEDQKLAKQLGPHSKKSEIMILYENGISPIKKPNPSFYSIPKFYSRFNPVEYARVEVDGSVVAETAVLHDIQESAIRNLDEKYGAIIAKKVAGVVAKEVVADQIEKHTNSPLLGFLSRVLFYVSDQADLRSWHLLPRDLQIARVLVEPGEHRIRILPVGDAPLLEKTVQVEAGKKKFLNFRYMP